MKWQGAILAIAASQLTSAAAFADQVVGPGGKPGVATRWSKRGDAVLLTIKTGFSASDVAEKIRQSVVGTSARADGSSVLVSGLPQNKLLAALEKIDIAPASDDVTSVITAVRGDGSEESSSGSSIRAGRDVVVLEPPAAILVATVVDVVHERFPWVVVTLSIEQATGPQAARLKPGTTVLVVPQITREKNVDPSNLGAWYARPGDRVKVELENEHDSADVAKKFWTARAFARH